MPRVLWVVLIALSSMACDSKKKSPALPMSMEAFEPLFAALPGVEVQEASAPKGWLGWAVPKDCSLSYDVDASFLMKMLGEEAAAKKMSNGMGVQASFAFRQGGPADFEVEHGELRIYQGAGDVRRPPVRQTAGTLAKTWLRSVDRGVVEVQGPTAAWSAFGTYHGPVLFFPPLPPVSAPEAAWKLLLHVRGSGMEVEMTRGTMKLQEGQRAPKPVSEARDAKVRIEKWVDVGGQRAALISARWGHDVAGTEMLPLAEDKPRIEMKSSNQDSFTGRYLVLASGQLLVGQVDGERNIKMSFMNNNMEQKHTFRFDVRLRKGCDAKALVASGFDWEMSTKERALETLVTLSKALAKEDPKAASALFSKALRDKHKDALGETLARYVKKYGPFALGSPQIARDVIEEDGLITVWMTGNTKTKPTTRLTLHIHAQLREVDGALVIESLGADTMEKTKAWELLEVSTNKLWVAPELP